MAPLTYSWIRDGCSERESRKCGARGRAGVEISGGCRDAASVVGLLITTKAMVADVPEPAGGGGMPGGGMPDMGGMGGMGM